MKNRFKFLKIRLLTAVVIGSVSGTAAEPVNLGTPKWSDAELPGRINLAPLAVFSESGGLEPRLWSVRNVASPTPRICVFDPKYGANTSLNAGWNSATGGAVDPVQPYLQFDFPFAEAPEIDTIIYWSRPTEAPEFEPPFLVERRLGGRWETVFQPRDRKETEAASIRFDPPFRAEAVRVRFIHPSASSYLLMRRFWIYTQKAPVRRFRGARLDLFVPEAAKTEGEIVFDTGADAEFDAVLTPAPNNAPDPAELRFRLADYWGRALEGTERRYDISADRCGSYPLRFSGLAPGAYRLECELRAGETVLFRDWKLFGIRGAAPPPPEIAALPAVPAPAFEFAGGIGQNLGPYQRFSTAVIDAYRKLNVNTIQLEPIWRDIEPLPGVFNFAELDRIFLYAARQGYRLSISLYASDGNRPPFLQRREYAMLDQLGRPAVGRLEWFMLLEGPPSSHAPILREHFLEVWRRIVTRYAPSGRINRYDLRPLLCERFYFDEFVNNARNTDGVADYSEWARLDYIRYLREYRKLPLAEVSRRAGTEFRSWDEVRMPRPTAGYRARQNDRREAWLDFLDFKNHHHPAEFFAPTVRMAAETDPAAQIFLRFHDRFYDDLLAAKRIAGGYFAIENGTLYFSLRHPAAGPRCFEWGDPAPNYAQFNAGLFNILPQLRGNGLRWVYNPMLGEERFNVPRYWKSFESLGRLAPHFAELTRYAMPHSGIALFGGFDQEFGRYETARPVRTPGTPGSFSSNQGGFGGLYAVLCDGLYRLGMAPLEDFSAVSAPETSLRLAIDGGNADVPEREVKKLLDFVRRGGEAVLWSNSCRFDGSRPSTLLRRALGVKGAFDQTLPDAVFRFRPEKDGEELRLTLTGGFRGVSVENGRPVGWCGGEPAAWRIPCGAGSVLYINGLPKTGKLPEWRAFVALLMNRAKEEPRFVAPPDSTLSGYALAEEGGANRMLVIFNSGPDAAACRVRFPGALDPAKRYEFAVLHRTEPETAMTSARQERADAELILNMKSRDLMIVKASPKKGE